MSENRFKSCAMLVLLFAVAAGADEPTDKVEITISGLITNSDGDPLAGARVALHFANRMGAEAAETVAQTTTKQHGKFVLPGLSLSNRLIQNKCYLLTVSSKGHVSDSVELQRLEQTEDLKVQLKSNPATLVGIVMDERGEPIEDAEVFLPVFGTHLVTGYCSDKTDVNGKFRIQDLKAWKSDNPNHPRKLVVRHPDFGRKYVPYLSIPEVIKVEIAMPAIVTGRVIDMTTGLPVPNVWVSAQGIGDSGWYQKQTDKNGVYRLLVAEDRYNIWAEMEDRVPIAIDSIAASKNQKQIGADIRMVRGAILTGKILGDDPTQFAGQRVASYGPARPRSGAAVLSAKVKADGSYELRVSPGENYVYLMVGRCSADIQVGDGQKMRLDLIPGRKQDLRKLKEDDIQDEKREQAAMHRRERALKLMAAKDPPKPATRERPASEIGKLLDKLESQNMGRLRFSDTWLKTLKEIVDLGEAAVPELIEELDQTESDMMMRCMGFTMRAIGDKRAVPALIRAIPKTLRPGGSDMGLRSGDAVLLAFARANDLDKDDKRKKGYGFGRPVREVYGAIHGLTGREMNDSELFSISLSGTKGQQQRKENLFQQRTKLWADWWEANAAKMVADKQYQSVDLPDFVPHEIQRVDIGIEYKTDLSSSNWMLEMAQAKTPRTVFFDLDTSRRAGLPKRYQQMPADQRPVDEIAKWARDEGFDMMGTEHHTEDGEPCYAIRLLGMRAMQLPDERWKMNSNGITLENLIDEATPIGEYLFHQEGGVTNYLQHGAFFVVTAEETPAIVFLGIEVRDDSLKPGGIAIGDHELDPVAFRKGRRFGFTFLVPAE